MHKAKEYEKIVIYYSDLGRIIYIDYVIGTFGKQIWEDDRVGYPQFRKDNKKTFCIKR